MFDFELLDEAEGTALPDGPGARALPTEAQDGEATVALAAASPARRGTLCTTWRPSPDGSLHQADPSDGIKELDDARWCRIVVEPSQLVLSKWARSLPVHEILSCFVIEEVVGAAEVIKFRDVYRLLEELSLSRAGLVAKFAEVPRSSDDVQKLADKILARFASASTIAAESAMRFRDLYRMLEVVGISMRKLVAKFSDGYAAEPEWRPMAAPRFGNYIVRREIGSGFHGPCCYMAEHATTRDRAAVKWPVSPEELAVLQDLHRQASLCPGLPQLLASGRFEGAQYAVTELLGSPLTKVFERLEDQPLDTRWAALQVIGRLLLRRLEAVHSCGYVHCDISPENVLLGRTRLAGAAFSKVTPYLIDFGLTQRHPNGKRLEGSLGSCEWSSVRSADGGRRIPEDDLEALGWVLVNGLFGELPWFERLSQAYPYWDSREIRLGAVSNVREAKLQLLEGGWDSHTGRWRKLNDVPDELDKYLKACRESGLAYDAAVAGRRPDYGRLAALLGGSAPDAAAGRLRAEEEDLRQYRDRVAPLLQ